MTGTPFAILLSPLAALLLCAATPAPGDPVCPGVGRLAVTTAESFDFYGDAVAVTEGWAVATSTGVGVGGGPEQGLVDIWRDGPGGWELSDQIQPYELADVDRILGGLAATGGDRMAFGAFDETGPGAGFGRVVVLQRTGISWQVDEVLSSGVAAAPGVPGDGFGNALSLDGDRLAVGAQAFSGDFAQQGAVHLFRREPSGWVADGVVFAPSPAAVDRFGAAVALSGDRLVVTATGVDQPGEDGAVYLFERHGGVWTLQDVNDPQSGAPDGQFGLRVVFKPPFVAVGAPQTTGQGGNATGSVHVYRVNGSQLVDDQLIDGTPEGHPGRTGESLGLSAGRLVIGSPATSEGVGGRAYVYELAQSVWTLTQTLAPCDGGDAVFFAEGLGLDGGRLLVGSPNLNRLHGFDHDGAAFAPAEDVLMGAEVSASRGAEVTLLIAGGGTVPGTSYVMLGSVSGTSPGVAIQGVPIPLNVDPWFQVLLGFPNGGAFAGFQGRLTSGDVEAHLFVPPGLPPSLVGLRFDHAWVEVLGNQIVSVSEAEGFEIIP